MTELNKKLTEWSNAEEYFTDEDGCRQRKIVRFTDDLNACFKWLLGDLYWKIELLLGRKELEASVGRDENSTTFRARETLEGKPLSEVVALALCKAVEQLIDEVKNE